MVDLTELEITFETIATITEKQSTTIVELVKEVQRLDRRVTALEQSVYDQ